MKKTRKFLILSIIFTVIVLLAMPVKADEKSFKSEVSSSKNTIKPGDTVDVIVSVKDINMGDNGINTLEGTISYDKDLFEQVKSSDIKSANNWSTTYNDEGTALDGKFFAATLNHGIKEDTQLITVTFKTKKDIEKTTTTKVEFKELTSNDGTNLINSGTKSVDITIEVEKKDENNTDNKDNNTNNNNNNSNNNNNNNNNSSNNGSQTNGNSNSGTNNGKTTTTQQNVDKTKTNSTLPKTGKTSFIIIAIIAGVILLIVFGIKTKNMRGI